MYTPNSHKLVNNFHILALYKLHNKLKLRFAPVALLVSNVSSQSSSTCRARHVECVDLCCSTSSKWPLPPCLRVAGYFWER